MPFGPRLPFAHRVTQEVAQRFVTADGKSAEVLAFEAARRDPAPALPDVRALSAVWCGAFLLDRAREDSTVCGEIGRKLLKKTLNPRTATTPAIFLGRALVMWAALLLPEGRGTEWDSYDREISELLTLDPSYRGALNACAGLALAEHDPRIEPPPGIVTGLLLARGLGEPFTAKDIKTHRDTAGLFFISEALRQVVWRALDDGQWTRAAPGLATMAISDDLSHLTRLAAERAAWTHSLATRLRPCASAAHAARRSQPRSRSSDCAPPDT